ncbi:hypothetical protein U9M48_007873 [Paspalum notatum var. saurae]|uniref:Ubiquitin-like domain-containing protein n=1 Tax=Paspalum notatum var. saurae TaxID=547442 RepID=A0AAQ3SN27_PASNO
MQQGSVGAPPFFAGWRLSGDGVQMEEAAEVEALAEKLNAIGVDGEHQAVVDMAVDDDDEVVARGTIKVKTLTGKEIDVDAGPTDPVFRIKQRVEETEGIPSAQQRLIFGGKQLADYKALSESSIEPGSVIHLVLALRGGGCS